MYVLSDTVYVISEAVLTVKLSTKNGTRLQTTRSTKRVDHNQPLGASVASFDTRPRNEVGELILQLLIGTNWAIRLRRLRCRAPTFRGPKINSLCKTIKTDAIGLVLHFSTCQISFTLKKMSGTILWGCLDSLE